MPMNKANINKILAVVASGFPGGQKILLASTMFYLFGAEYVGEYSVLIAMPTIISMFTAIGLGAKLMVVIPGSDIKQRRFNSMMMAGLLYVIASISFLIVISVIVKIDLSLLSLSAYLLYLTMYQLFRHYYMAEKRYYEVLFLDFFITAISIGSLFFLFNVEEYVLYSSVLSIFFIVLLYFTYCRDYSFNGEYFLEAQSLQFSLNTGLSGGVSAFFPIVINSLFGASTTGGVVMALTYFAPLQLLSRSYMNYVMPDLVKINNKLALSVDVLSSVRNSYFKIIGGVIVVSIFLPLIYFYCIPQYESIGVIYAVLIFSLSGSLGVVEGAFLFVVSRQIVNIYSNVLYVFLFTLVCAFSHFFAIELVCFLILSSIASFLRWPYLNYYVRKSI